MSQCELMVNSTNPWYDRLVEFQEVSVCQGQYEAIKNQNDSSEMLEKSYFSSLDLNMNAQMARDYDDCINLEVLDDPNMWATTFVQSHPMFQIWTPDQQLLAAAEAGALIT